MNRFIQTLVLQRNSVFWLISEEKRVFGAYWGIHGTHFSKICNIMGTQWISFIVMYSSKYWKIKINIPKSTQHFFLLFLEQNHWRFIYFKLHNIIFGNKFVSFLYEIFIFRLGMYPFILSSPLWQIILFYGKYLMVL